MNWVVTGVLIATALLGGLMLLSVAHVFVRAAAESFLTALRDAGDRLRARIVFALSPTMAISQDTCAASQIALLTASGPRAPHCLLGKSYLSRSDG